MKILKGRKIKERKIVVLGIIFFVLLIALVAIPTLSSYKNRTLSQNITVWDGTIAEDYRGGVGTEDNPYIIANGEELAYFASQLKVTNYDGVYFKLSNNIVLNDGMFSYDETNAIKYIKDGVVNAIDYGLENNFINEFSHLNNFKGTFDGDFYTIFGVYIDDKLEDGQNALFTNLEGNIKNLYIENSVIYGGKITGGVVSKSNGAILTNVLYDGFVISDEEVNTATIEKNLEDITLSGQGIELNESLSVSDLEYIPGLVTEVVLSGNYSTDNNGVLKINDQSIEKGNFQITLGNKVLSTILLNYQSSVESDINISITDLNYQIKYNYGNAAGIVSMAENTTLQNVINKARVNASVYGAGIINFVTGTTNLINVYNNGKIDSNNVSSGLISGINRNNKDTIIINCYNNGELNAQNVSMIGNLEYNSGNIILENIFNPQDIYTINLVEESNVLVKNSYAVISQPINFGISNGEFIQATKENLEDKSFVSKNLQYEKFEEDETKIESSWIFLDSSHPKLFIDYSKANIHIGEHKWDEYNKQLNTLNFSKKFVFSIGATNELNTIKEIYYFISNSEDVLSKNDLNESINWVKYENIVEIDKEGIYTIYAKIIGNDNTVTYLNSDFIILDFTGATITISTMLGDTSWEKFHEELNTYYINESINVIIDAEDLLSGIKEIYYYANDEILSLEQLDALENWVQYKESILINDKKTIVYAKVIDNCGNVTYVNTDFIVLNGYTLNKLYPGMKGEEVEHLRITQNSSVSLNFSYLDVSEYSEGNKHQLISNVLLPENTIITIIDKLKDKVYKYITTDDNYGYEECLNNNCYATYDFELFNEVGTTNKFKENSYTGAINEDFIINIDFKNTKIMEDIENIEISLNLYNEIETKTTIQSTIKDFSINVLKDAYFTLFSQFGDIIKYSENEKYIIDFQTKLNYNYMGEHKVYDTTFEDKQIGLAIKLLSPNGNVVERTHLKNILFQLGDKKYSPSSDGVVRINLSDGLNDVTDKLIIQTFNDNSKLEEGNYKLEVSLYTAYDGIYSNEYLTNLDIPVYVGENSYKNDVNFNIEMSSEDKIITTDINEFNFKFLYDDDISKNINIKVSLYKKSTLSAFDQKYTIIDLGDYLLDNSLEKYDENIYYVFKDIKNNEIFNINLDIDTLEKNGYMFVFELYKADKLVSKINKKFIVK